MSTLSLSLAQYKNKQTNAQNDDSTYTKEKVKMCHIQLMIDVKLSRLTSIDKVLKDFESVTIHKRFSLYTLVKSEQTVKQKQKRAK